MISLAERAEYYRQIQLIGLPSNAPPAGVKTTVERHAMARELEIHIWIDNNRVYCVVSDDGIGFNIPAKEACSRSGLGLLGIEERVYSVGGECSIVSRPGEGAQLQVAIPL